LNKGTHLIITAATILQKEEDFALEDEEEGASADKTETKTLLNNSTPTLGVTVPGPDSTVSNIETTASEPDADSGGKRSGPGSFPCLHTLQHLYVSKSDSISASAHDADTGESISI